MTNFSPFELLQLKTLFALGLMKLKKIFLKISEALKFMKFRVQFIPFSNSRWERRIFEKTVSDVKVWYIIFIPCSII